jgi:hypothetical protein
MRSPGIFGDWLVIGPGIPCRGTIHAGLDSVLGHHFHRVVFALHQGNTAPYDPPRKRLTAPMRDYEIIGDVLPQNVRGTIDPEFLWPPSATVQTAAGTNG